MIKQLSIYIGVLFFVTSCFQYKKPEKPKNLISKEMMVNILIDSRLISSANGKNKTILIKNGLNEETYIYEKYKIDSLQFALSNRYYSFYTEEYETIYTKVIDSLEILKKDFKALEVVEKKQDSINKLKRKDSIVRFKERDSLRSIIIRDSLKSIKLKNKTGLIKPVSDKDYQ